MAGGEGQGALTFRNEVYAAAEQRCADLADESFPDRVSDNCSVVIDNFEPVVTPIWRDGDDYQFTNVTSGTIVHALGIQSGDVPQTLNDIDISSPRGAFQAWDVLRNETEFELVVLRGTTSVTLLYQVIFS